jgi:hypothetical protein
MNAPTSLSDVQAAMSLLQNMYFNPILRVLVRHRVPDHLDHGPLSASDIAHHAGMNSLSLTRVLRALSAFGAFQEVSRCIRQQLCLESASRSSWRSSRFRALHEFGSLRESSCGLGP